MSDALHLVCPACGAINRVPGERLGEAPACGQCHRPLFTGHAHALDEAAYQRQIERNDVPVLVDFWATWCPPCKMMAPEFERAAAELEPRVRLIKVDTDQAQATAARLGIRSIPTLVLFHRGRELARRSGASGAADIVRWTRSHLAPTAP